MGRSSLSLVTDYSAKEAASSVYSQYKQIHSSLQYSKDLDSIKIIEPPSLPHDLKSIEQKNTEAAARLGRECADVGSETSVSTLLDYR